MLLVDFQRTPGALSARRLEWRKSQPVPEPTKVAGGTAGTRGVPAEDGLRKMARHPQGRPTICVMMRIVPAHCFAGLCLWLKTSPRSRSAEGAGVGVGPFE